MELREPISVTVGLTLRRISGLDSSTTKKKLFKITDLRVFQILLALLTENINKITFYVLFSIFKRILRENNQYSESRANFGHSLFIQSLNVTYLLLALMANEREPFF